MEALIVSVGSGLAVALIVAGVVRTRKALAGTEATRVIGATLGGAVAAAAGPGLTIDERRWRRDVHGLVRALDRSADGVGGDDDPEVSQRELENQLRRRLSHRDHGGLTPEATFDSDAFWRHLTDERLDRLSAALPATSTVRERRAAEVLCAMASVVRRHDICELLAEIRRDMTDRERLPAYLPEDLDVAEVTRPVTVRADEPDRPDQRGSGPESDVEPGPRDPGQADGGDAAPKPGDGRGRREVVMPWREALRGAPRLVVLGEPGYGKSWLVRAETARLAQEALDALDGGAAPDTIVVPVAVRCDELIQAGGRTSTDRLVAVLRERFEDGQVSARAFGWLADRIRARHAVVFIDAWDELPGIPERHLVKKVLAALPAAADGEPGRIVLTSRPADYVGVPMPRPFREVQLRPFAVDDVEAVLAAWRLDDHAANLLRARLDEPAIAAMARNPLLLALLCLVAARDRDLPSARWDLYERVVDEFAMRDRALPATSDGGTDPMSHDRLLVLLGRVATAFATRPGGWVDHMSATELRAVVERVGLGDDDARAQIGRMTRSGLITASRARVGRLPESYRFVHRTLAAFFVARNLAQETEDVSVVVDRQLWGNSAWADVVALLGSRRPDEVIGHLLDVGDDPFHLALRMAARVVTEMPEQDIPAHHADRIVDRLLTLLSLTKDRVYEPPSEGLRQAVGGLAPRLPTPSLQRVLGWAAESDEYDLGPVLGGVAHRVEVRDWMLEQMAADSDRYRSRRAVIDLMTGALDDDRVVDALIGLLGGEWTGDAAATALAPAAHRDRVRRELVANARDNPATVSSEAFVALGRLAVDDDEIRSVLLAAAGHEEMRVRARAMEGLGPVTSEVEVRRVLLAGLADDTLVRLSALGATRAMVEFADARQALVTMLADRSIDADARSAVVSALRPCRDDTEVAEALVRAFREDPDDDVRRQAARVLAGASWLTTTDARDIAAVVEQGLEAPPDVATPAGRRDLIELLATGDDDVVYRAGQLVAAAAEDAGMRADLVRLLADESRRAARSVIATAFAARDDDDIRPALLDLATAGPSSAVRADAILGLGGLHRPDVAAVVVGALAAAGDLRESSAAAARLDVRYTAPSDDDAARQLVALCRALDTAPRDARVNAFGRLEERATGAYGGIGDDADRAFVHRVLSRITRDATVGFASRADIGHLRRCIELASAARDSGDEPFGSVLIGPAGDVLFEDHNRVAGGDQTRHPEFEIARWAVSNLAPEDRSRATVYTSGEHCPMCSAAHAWVGLGRIVIAASSEQLGSWLAEWDVPASPVRPLSIREVAPDVDVVGPVPELADEVRELHRRFHQR